MIRSHSRSGCRPVPCLRALTLVGAALLPAAARAQTASALLRENEPLPGGGAGDIVSSLGNTACNSAAGFAVTCNTTSSTASLSHVWGSAAAGPGAPLRTESVIGNFDQQNFESFYGMGDLGELGYSASCNNTVSGSTSLDSVWLDGSFIAMEEEPVLSIPGQFWSFGSRPGVTRAGVPFWVGGITSTAGGSTENRGLFFGNAGTVLLLGGQAVPGLPFVLSNSSTVSFDYRFSGDGAHYLAEVQMASGSSTDDGALVLDGSGLVLGGGLVREGSPIPAAIGGLAGEGWDNFDYCGVNDAGRILFTGDSDGASATDEIVVVGDQIVLREGDLVDGQTLSGSIEGGFQNEDGDVALIWDIVDGAAEVLLFNGEILLREGDLVDWDGNGKVEAGSILTNFTGISSLSIADRDAQGEVAIYFTADVDRAGVVEEGFFCLNATTREIRLRATPQLAAAGDDLDLLVTGGTPGGPALVYAIAVDGAPFFSRIASGSFDATGCFCSTYTVPPGLSGIELVLTSFGKGASGKFVKSNPATIDFQ